MLKDISSQELDKRRLEAIRILGIKGKDNVYYENEANKLEKAHYQQLELRKGGTYKCQSRESLCNETHRFGGPAEPEEYPDDEDNDHQE